MTQYTPAQLREFAETLEDSASGYPVDDAATALRSLADQVEELQALSVTKILLRVDPGDGSGFEVYAKSVADAEAELYKLGSELEDWQLGIKRHPEMESKIRELQAQLTELRLQKIAEFGELQDAAPVVPAPGARVSPADMLVNGGALQMALNILRRGTPVQQEAAEELAKTAAPVVQLSEPLRTALRNADGALAAQRAAPVSEAVPEDHSCPGCGDVNCKEVTHFSCANCKRDYYQLFGTATSADIPSVQPVEVQPVGSARAFVEWIQAQPQDRETLTLVETLAEFESSAQRVAEVWRPMETAPKDGTMLRLLVNFEHHATEDAEGPSPTIGANTWDNHHDFDEWQFAGWNWEQDCWTQGVGTPVGWLPIHAAAQPVEVQPAQTDAEGLYWRLQTLSKMLEGSGRIDELEHPDAYATVLDAMGVVRSVEVQRAPLTNAEIDRLRQLVNAVEDVSPGYMQPEDWQLSAKLTAACGLRVPNRVTEAANGIKPAGEKGGES